MNSNQKFFEGYRREFDSNLSDNEFSQITTFLNFVREGYSRFSKNQWAYVFATVYHETAHTFAPVKEAFWKTEDWRQRNFRYFPYYGRGYVQITWVENYIKFGKLLKRDLKNSPNDAMMPRVAFNILVLGFENGLFTGKKISDYIFEAKKDYKGCRRCINGTDKAELIASYALKFENIL